jgi:hypothetical protein
MFTENMDSKLLLDVTSVSLQWSRQPPSGQLSPSGDPPQSRDDEDDHFSSSPPIALRSERSLPSVSVLIDPFLIFAHDIEKDMATIPLSYCSPDPDGEQTQTEGCGFLIR